MSRTPIVPLIKFLYPKKRANVRALTRKRDSVSFLVSSKGSPFSKIFAETLRTIPWFSNPPRVAIRGGFPPPIKHFFYFPPPFPCPSFSPLFSPNSEFPTGFFSPLPRRDIFLRCFFALDFMPSYNNFGLPRLSLPPQLVSMVR